jgi:hypothetical protein
MTPEEIGALTEEWCGRTNCGLAVGIAMSKFGTRSGAFADLFKFLSEKVAERIAAERNRIIAIVDREREEDGDPEQLRNLIAAIREGK